MDIKELIVKLSDAVSIGNITEARDIAYGELSKYADCRKTDSLTVIGEIKGESDYTLMLDAHIDEVGFIVKDIDKNGFLTVEKCGGIDLRSLPSRVVTIHGKRAVTGVFCSTPPHLKEKANFESIDGIKIDTLLGSAAAEVISIGDYMTYNAKAAHLSDRRISGKALDDRVGVAVLLDLARRLSAKRLPFNVVFCISDMEELGTRGARTATYEVSPDEAIAIDVSFADGPDIPALECGKLGGGAMVGIAPILDRQMSDKLTALAASASIPYQTEVMGSATGTDGDVISITRKGVRTAVVSIPIRNMHTDVEIVDINDVTAVCDLLEKYILEGGVR